jgi:hypothetical protein
MLNQLKIYHFSVFLTETGKKSFPISVNKELLNATPSFNGRTNRDTILYNDGAWHKIGIDAYAVDQKNYYLILDS